MPFPLSEQRYFKGARKRITKKQKFKTNTCFKTIAGAEIGYKTDGWNVLGNFQWPIELPILRLNKLISSLEYKAATVEGSYLSEQKQS